MTSGEEGSRAGTAERINGRIAMMGVVITILAELASGKSILRLWEWWQ